MQHVVDLPQVELNMESVEVLRWCVDVGDLIDADQPILEVETQKATVEVPSPVAGYLRVQLVEAGAEIGEKALLCVLTDEPDESFQAPSDAPSGATDENESAQSQPDVSAAAPPTATSTDFDAPIRATPLARKIAREHSLNLAAVSGTGPARRIKSADVEAHVQSDMNQAGTARLLTTVAGPGWSPLPSSRIALIAQMSRAVAEIPQIQVTRQLDVTQLAVKTPGVTFTHRMVRAAAAALIKHPSLRTRIRGEHTRTDPVSVAVAMDTPQGLFAPVVRAADSLSLEQVSQAVKALQKRAGTGALKREEMADGPFAITNLGMLGIDQFDPLVFDGQTAVLAVGRATEASAGRRVAWFTLAVDHRVVDGAEAARFLQSLQEEALRA